MPKQNKAVKRPQMKVKLLAAVPLKVYRMRGNELRNMVGQVSPWITLAIVPAPERQRAQGFDFVAQFIKAPPKVKRKK